MNVAIPPKYYHVFYFKILGDLEFLLVREGFRFRGDLFTCRESCFGRRVDGDESNPFSSTNISDAALMFFADVWSHVFGKFAYSFSVDKSSFNLFCTSSMMFLTDWASCSGEGFLSLRVAQSVSLTPGGTWQQQILQ